MKKNKTDIARDIKSHASKVGAAVDLRKNPPKQTHSVFFEGTRWRYPAYQDGDVLRHLIDGEILARKTRAGWDANVMAVTQHKHPFDTVVGTGTPQVMHLTVTGKYF